jgi:hypothetical protein
LEKFDPEIVLLSGFVVDEWNPAERKYFFQPLRILKLSVYHTTQVED